jgi:hypothetical protein
MLLPLTCLSLIHQFEDIGRHGTKIIIYNLWLNDEGIYELSFDDDEEVCCFYVVGCQKFCNNFLNVFYLYFSLFCLV